MMSIRKAILRGVATLVIAGGGAALTCPPALASEALGLVGTFGSASSSPADPEPLSEPTGVAFDQSSNDVYVADRGNDRVEYFSSTGSYIGQFDGSATPAGAFSSPSGIAIDNSGNALDPSAGDVYVIDGGHDVVDKFSSTGSYEGQLTAGEGGAAFGEIDGVAVDPAGQVWVYQGSGEVDSYSDGAGNEFLAARSMSQAPGFPQFGLAIDSEDNIYVVSRGALVVSKLDSKGSLLKEEIGGVEEVSGVAVDTANNALYVDKSSSLVSFSAGGVQIESAGPVSQGSGIAVDATSGEVYVAQQGTNTVGIFAPGPATPAPHTDPATAVGSTSATLNGDLNPEGVVGGVGFYFSYAIGTSCAGPGSITTAFDNGGANATGSGAVAESASVTGLQPNASYAFCFVADKFGVAFGGVLRFTTAGAAPALEGPIRQQTTVAEAALGAIINQNNQDTQCKFEYVDDAHYDMALPNPYAAGAAVPCSPVDLGSHFGGELGLAVLKDLTPGTTYHVRVVATNASGITEGPDEIVKTAPSLPPVIEAESAAAFAPPGVAFEGEIDTKLADTSYYFQYGTTTGYTSGQAPVPGGEIPGASPSQNESARIGVNVLNLAGDTTYHYRLVAINGAGTVYGPDQTFQTPAPPPNVSTGPASSITKSDATLAGTVNPEGLATHYYYQYGAGTEYGSRAPASPGIAAGAGSTDVSVTFALTALTPGTTYHYRIVASNEDGTSYGEDATFTTVADALPIVSTGAASGISVSAATISGTVDPQGTDATYEFEYGADASYGSQAFGTAFAQQGAQTVTLSLQGLRPDATYHYRMVASNPGGTTVGADQTFTTPGILDPLAAPISTPLIAIPSIVFPASGRAGGANPATRKLTNAQKLAIGLRACKRDRSKKKRIACERQARKKYPLTRGGKGR